MAKYLDVSIADPIERNARDPVRKLGPYERIVGPLNLCRKHGLPYGALATTARAALAYREPSDPAAVELAKLVDEKGAWGAVQQLAPGLPEEMASELGTAGWKGTAGN